MPFINNQTNFPPYALSAILTSSAANVTGDGTIYTLICDTVQYVSTADYDTSTGIWTPTADIITANAYQFNINIALSGLIVTNTDLKVTLFSIAASSNFIVLYQGAAFTAADSTGTLYLALSSPALSFSSSPFQVNIQISGNASANVTVIGNSGLPITTEFCVSKIGIANGAY